MTERGVGVHTFEAECSDELTVRNGEEVIFSLFYTCLIPGQNDEHVSTIWLGVFVPEGFVLR